MGRILYHYTDFSSLDGILSNYELRVNNVLNMNDAQEMELFISGLFSAVTKRFSEIQDDAMVNRLNIMHDAIRDRRFDYPAYAACFSEFRDDAAQWERYANKGKGVCLCFDEAVLSKLTGGAIELHKVFYTSNVDDHPLVDRFFKLLQEKKELANSPELRDAAHEALRNSASFKHPSFSSEHEIRLTVMPFEVPDFELIPKYHISRERIKKYYPLDLKKMCSENGVTVEDLIIELIIGPESTQSPSILRDYLNDMGFPKLAGHITTSDCPLRSKI